MPSFDITSEFNQQEVINAIDQMNREIINRYDFKDTNTSVSFSNSTISLRSATEERLNAADQVLREKFAKRNVSIKFLSNFNDEQTPSEAKREYTLKSGLDKEISKQNDKKDLLISSCLKIKEIVRLLNFKIMENLALIESFSEFKDEKYIDRVTLMSILEEVFRNTLKRKFGDDDNFDVIINPDKGDLEIWRNRIVVNDGEVEDENSQISLTDAQKIEPDFEVGEDVSEEVKLVDLGRRVVLSLRQNLVAKIHEHDNMPPQALGLFEKNRLILLYTYESDLGDGWEDESVHKDPWEIREKALKMGTNIIPVSYTHLTLPTSDLV